MPITVGDWQAHTKVDCIAWDAVKPRDLAAAKWLVKIEMGFWSSLPCGTPINWWTKLAMAVVGSEEANAFDCPSTK